MSQNFQNRGYTLPSKITKQHLINIITYFNWKKSLIGDAKLSGQKYKIKNLKKVMNSVFLHLVNNLFLFKFKIGFKLKTSYR